MIRIQDIIDKVWDYNPDADFDLIERAYIFSARVHDGQVRLSGEPYLSHPLEVAGILADMHLDVTSIGAGLLHDVVEDTHATPEQIDSMFGADMAHIVKGVTKLSKLSFRSSQERQAESIRKMILAMADDIRVVLIKLADRVHNMRTLQFQKENKQVRIAQETLDIYAPIAGRLGIYWIKQELEDRSSMYLYPEQYREIENLQNQKKHERDAYVEKVKGILHDKLGEAGLKGQILGRYKSFYSIYNKMLQQNLEFEEVYDIIAFRVILDTIPQCYEALGLVHNIWKPIAKKFKDYIGNPKPNMYQSLHTTVIGPFGERMEIQIRTQEMDAVAKSGIAAHWSYKEGKQADEKTRQAFAWIQDIVEHQKNVKDPQEFLENVRIELFPDEVYVFTPAGDVKALPRGATPLDFAYAIHSEVGNHCTGAKVNGRMVPLRTELKTGDSVEIRTQKKGHPSKDWLLHVKTVKARTRIRQWIKTEERERSLALGREMCEKTFRRNRMALSTMLNSPEVEKIYKDFGYKDADSMLAAVGYGKLTPLQILKKWAPQPDSDEENKLPTHAPAPSKKKKDATGILVKGMDDMLIRFGKCCNPLPGDPVVGYITRGHGVTVHLKGCVNAMQMDPERAIEVEWAEDVTQTYPVRLYVRANDRVGLLADITAAVSQCDANITSINTRLGEDQQANVYLVVQVAGKDRLDVVIASIRKVNSVTLVKRQSR
ncbi:(p)ppGpp synthetase I, SpoT/RelA [Desulfatibacillum aliphaticivorans]|uniref:(P)ppGpp synthetase I, SpoT/RelA n=1 Tax=Desulfatibacillum aliphaticivorans TaxID=218208 RepID=B8FDZ7_DESAL|nr:bifunctional (p)ppGpp synthetase/guanosine-3',5'-bis(diphosphate) 3'-pyrophosphohydrolase [Desulfatibacillum aliphaticivorans]ACL06778.1 (p)ppGpp synthetase I, SpoT/RelA [Desulfatibacillum aliphaticivorans]